VGSVFKNPPGHFVAKLIQDAGLKGKKIRGAKVSDLHANFIENFNKATSRDVLDLVSVIREAVKKRTGIELELEMKVVGEETQSEA
jgi:UDP-N-acetylmuramate dehydrogenase